MPFEILTCHGDDAKRWDALIASLPAAAQDVHFTSAYARVQEVIGANPLMLVNSGIGGKVLHPIDLRIIGVGPHLDATNLYGYGGWYADGSAPPIRDEISDWIESVGAVSEFCTAHPLFHIIAPPKPSKYVALMRLTDSHEKLRADMRRAHRRSIKKADDSGVHVERVEINPENMLLMASLYRESMKRLGAEKRWVFPISYFDAHANELGEEGCSLYFAYLPWPDAVIRSLLVIHHGETAYAHFLGSTGTDMRFGADEKLYWTAALDLKKLGFKTFHLGGGATSSPDDTLFQFKAGFSDCTLPVYRTFRVFDQARYDALCAERLVQEIAEHGRGSRSEFKPAYRREWT